MCMPHRYELNKCDINIVDENSWFCSAQYDEPSHYVKDSKNNLMNGEKVVELCACRIGTS